MFSIDGSFAASVSIMGSDPKVRAGAVDVVRYVTPPPASPTPSHWSLFLPKNSGRLGLPTEEIIQFLEVNDVLSEREMCT